MKKNAEEEAEQKGEKEGTTTIKDDEPGPDDME